MPRIRLQGDGTVGLAALRLAALCLAALCLAALCLAALCLAALCLAACGGDGGATAAAPATVAVTVTPPTAALVAGGSVSSHAVSVARTGAGSGPVTVTVTGAPTGLSTTLSASAIASGVGVVTLELRASAAVAAGTYPLTVTATGAGVASATATVTATVVAAPPAGSFTLTVSPATIAVRPGQTTTATVTIARAGGFAGAVELTTSGLPAGVTASVTPAASGATIQLVAAATATPGTSTLTVTGTAAGSATQTAVASVVVTAAGAVFAEQYCRADPLTPVFYAIQDGVAGAWTRVVPESASTTLTYRVAPTQPKITIATVAGVGPRGGAPYTLTVVYTTPGELVTVNAPHRCDAANGRTISGTVAGLSGTRGSIISLGALGAATALVTATPTRTAFTTPALSDVPLSVIAARVDSISAVVDRVILRRGVTTSAIGTLDFNGAEAFAPASIRVTVRGLRADEGGVITARYAVDAPSSSLIAANAVARLVPESLIWAAGPLTGTGSGTVTYYALPDARVQADERQILDVQGQSSASVGSVRGTAVREAAQVCRAAGDQTLTLGPTVATPRIADAGTSPYRRPTITLARQAEYGRAVAVVTTAGANFVSLQMSSGYAGAGDWTMLTPDLSAVPGWRAEYAPQTGTALVSGVGAFGFDASAGTYASAAFFGSNLPTNGFVRAAARTWRAPAAATGAAPH